MTDAFKAAPNPSSGLRGISLISIVANTLILGERLRLYGNLTSLDSMPVGENLRQSIRLEHGDFQVRVFRESFGFRISGINVPNLYSALHPSTFTHCCIATRVAWLCPNQGQRVQ